jgi:trans-aconitate methyltransferase
VHPLEFPSWLVDSEPQIPLDSLVREINNLYHSFEAASYDRTHPEIFQVLPALWEEMVKQLPDRQQWSILDFGCGTGFEASQVAPRLTGRIERMVCFDPSPEMLAQCKPRLSRLASPSFCTRLEEVQVRGPFNLLLTNSLLHHLPSIRETMNSLLPLLTPGAFWLAGHEPSARFFRNPDCMRFLHEYSSYHQWARFLDPGAYIAKVRMVLGQHPLRATAKAALKRGLFKKLPSPLVIDRIVDFHVPHTLNEVKSGRGLDFERMKTELAPEWSLKWIKTYSFFGAFKQTNAPQEWILRSNELAKMFPQDGANFAMVWTHNEVRREIINEGGL